MAQPNVMTFSVNTDNDDGTTPAVDITYTRYDGSHQNRSIYIASGHTVASRNLLTLYRTPPKPSGNFRGVAKSAVKVTQDFIVPGVDATTENVSPGLVDIGFNFPVGLTPAQNKELRMRAAAIISDDDVMVPLTDQLMV